MFTQRLKLIVLCLFTTFSVIKANPVRLHVYVNTNQCVNCNIALNALHDLKDAVIKTVYFPKSNMAVSEEIMESYHSVNNLKLDYFSKEANPFKRGLTSSYCLLYNGILKVDSFELQFLFSKIGTINKMLFARDVKTVELKNKITIPDSLKFSDRLLFFKHKNKLSICDYLTNKNVTLTFNESFTGLQKALQIKGSAFKPYPFLKSGIVDTALYRLKYEDIKYLGKTKPQINTSYVTDSSLYLFLTFPCPITVGRDTGIGGTYFMYRKNLFTLKSELFAIPDDVLPDKKLDMEYFVINVNPFYIRNNKFYFTIYPDSTQKENYYLSEYEKTGNRIMYRSVIDKKISDSTYLNTVFGNTQLFLTGGNSSYYYGIYQPLIIDTKTNAFFNFKKALGSGYEHSLIIRDVMAINEDEIAILAQHMGVEKKWIYNTKKNTLVSETELKFVTAINLESLKFISPEQLLAFEEDGKNVLIYFLK